MSLKWVIKNKTQIKATTFRIHPGVRVKKMKDRKLLQNFKRENGQSATL